MTIKQMHIELNQSLQKIASNTTRKFLSEELDWVLNKMQIRFIQSKLRPDPKVKGKVSIDQIDADALRNIIVTGQDIITEVLSPTRTRAVLPADYMHLLSDASNIIKECNVPTGGQTETISQGITYSIIKTTKSANIAAPYYTGASMTINGTTITIPTDLPTPSQYSGYKSKDDLSELVAYFIMYFATQGYQLYWESVDGLYKPGCFIYWGTVTTLNWTVDGITTNLLTTIMKTKDLSNRVDTTLEVYTPNRLEATETIPDLLRTPFYGTSPESPISELAKDYLYVYKDKNFRISGVQINYVRKPRRLSLSLSVDCELAEECHQTICDLATEYIKGRMEDAPGQQLITQDNETRVTL